MAEKRILNKVFFTITASLTVNPEIFFIFSFDSSRVDAISVLQCNTTTLLYPDIWRHGKRKLAVFFSGLGIRSGISS
jgi:hypothetical protein